MATEINGKVQTLEIEGLDINYVDAGSGHPIIVFPGKDDDSADLIVEKIADSHRIIFLQLPIEDYPPVGKIGRKLAHALTRLGIEHCCIIAFSSGAPAAIALAVSAPEQIDRLILLSPSLYDAELPDLAEVKASTLVLIGTQHTGAVIEAGRLCRERISSCHLSFIYGERDALTQERTEAWLKPIVQFLEQGEQFIIFRESQVIRP
ncbi:MAG: alpha/beta hydrolase [Deltaproteobacteria bacterium]|nr:alpha/beta hydrolase [Deltaproteobacteria bacterium]